MVDKEKVIKGLEICSEHGAWHGCDCELNEAYKDCPYHGCETGCVVTIAKDAIALLKEQKKRINELEEKLRLLEYGDQDIIKVTRCKDCKHAKEWSFYRNSDRTILCALRDEATKPDWFCADGEMR